MNTAEKQELFFTWLETPREERKPKFRSWLTKELGVNPATLNEWEDKRRELQLKKAKEEIDKLPTSYDELVKIALSYDNSKKAELARAKMWVIGMEGKGNWKSLTDFLKSIGDFVEKREETHKIDGSTIAPAVLDALEELERQGVVKVQIQPNSLSDKLHLTSGQSEEENNKI